MRPNSANKKIHPNPTMATSFLRRSKIPTSFPGSLFSASLSRWNRNPGCGWSRDHLSIQNRRAGGYSSTFGREDDKIHPCCPTLPANFSTTQILGGHVTSRNQGLCSNDEGRQRIKNLGKRLRKSKMAFLTHLCAHAQ